MDSKCKASFTGKHNYQPRYDSTPPDNLKNFKGCGESFEKFVRLLTKKTYVCDVCVICGKMAHRADMP